MRGILLRGVGGFFYALDDTGEVHQLRAQAKIRRVRMKPLVGDWVEFEPRCGEEDGWLKSIEPRRNSLIRPPVANIDLVALVVATRSPDPDLMLIDRMLVTAERLQIRVRLVINKCDLDSALAEDIARQYRGAQVDPILVSAKTGEGIEQLRQALRGSVHAFSGQSGAGKSTLLNALYGLQLETGDLSRKIERGKNTTRHCELIPLQSGGMALDTPGFSLLETEVFDPVELQKAYPEFVPYEGECFFSPCYHDSEPKCRVLEAVKQGEIDPNRHARYRALLEETKQRWRERYG